MAERVEWFSERLEIDLPTWEPAGAESFRYAVFDRVYELPNDSSHAGVRPMQRPDPEARDVLVRELLATMISVAQTNRQTLKEHADSDPSGPEPELGYVSLDANALEAFEDHHVIQVLASGMPFTLELDLSDPAPEAAPELPYDGPREFAEWAARRGGAGPIDATRGYALGGYLLSAVHFALARLRHFSLPDPLQAASDGEILEACNRIWKRLDYRSRAQLVGRMFATLRGIEKMAAPADHPLHMSREQAVRERWMREGDANPAKLHRAFLRFLGWHGPFPITLEPPVEGFAWPD